MFLNILRMESDKIFKRWLLWIGLIIVVLPMVGLLIASFNADVIPRHYLVGPGALSISLAFANGYIPGEGFGAYLLLIVVGVVMAQEYSWRTMQVWLSHGVSRPLLLTVKFVLSLLVAMVIILAFLLVGGIISLIFTYVQTGSVYISQIDVPQLLLSYLRTTYSLLPYAMLTFLLAIVSRSMLVAVGGGVLYMLAIEPLVSLLLPLFGKSFAGIAQYLPVGLSQTLTVQNYVAAKIVDLPISASATANPVVATILVAVYTLVMFGIALWVFQRQNLTN